MPLTTGIWKANVNGSEVDLKIGCPGFTGDIDGKVRKSSFRSLLRHAASQIVFSVACASLDPMAVNAPTPLGPVFQATCPSPRAAPGSQYHQREIERLIKAGAPKPKRKAGKKR